jgi:N-formylglutamate amidohydrolase
MLRNWICCGLLVMLGVPQPQTELAPSQALVTAWRGELPLILSAPHGGEVRVPGSQTRKSGVVVRDENTAELALLISQEVTDKLGAKPYVVIAQFSRKDADANRAATEAFENAASEAHYRAYHAALRQAVDECRERFGEALLVDLHGQVKRPAVIARGTRDGRTMQALERRKGPEYTIGASSIGGRLLQKGYDVVPRTAADGSRTPEVLFNGGYIVAEYGTMSEKGIDAIQLEFGEQRRQLLTLARDCGEVLASFLKEAGYLELKAR